MSSDLPKKNHASKVKVFPYKVTPKMMKNLLGVMQEMEDNPAYTSIVISDASMNGTRNDPAIASIIVLKDRVVLQSRKLTAAEKIELSAGSPLPHTYLQEELAARTGVLAAKTLQPDTGRTLVVCDCTRTNDTVGDFVERLALPHLKIDMVHPMHKTLTPDQEALYKVAHSMCNHARRSRVPEQPNILTRAELEASLKQARESGMTRQ